MNRNGIPVAAILILAGIFVIVFRYKLTDWNDKTRGKDRSSAGRARHASLAFLTAAFFFVLAFAALFLI